jgi:hypothetical protein
MDKMIIDNDTFFADVLRLLDQGKRVTIPVKGLSMLPFIRGGKDLVVLEKAGEVLEADDIVLFHVGPRVGGRYVMHRILSMDGDAVDIQGDGVPETHEHVRRNQVIAKAVEILRGGKRRVDPYGPGQRRLVHFWQWLRPVRRYILFIYRHLPWNRSWIKENRSII